MPSIAGQFPLAGFQGIRGRRRVRRAGLGPAVACGLTIDLGGTGRRRSIRQVGGAEEVEHGAGDVAVVVDLDQGCAVGTTQLGGEPVAESGEHLGQRPLARRDTEAGPADCLLVHDHDAVARPGDPLHPVVATVIGNFEEFVGHRPEADLARVRVPRRKGVPLVVSPAAHGAFVGHASVAADDPERLSVRETIKNFASDFLGVGGRPAYSLGRGGHLGLGHCCGLGR